MTPSTDLTAVLLAAALVTFAASYALVLRLRRRLGV